MSGPSAPNDIVFFHYKFSPYARRIAWYLTLRNIEYAECLQPPIMPRPDLSALGVNYRRIPVLAMGRDIYLDTRLILQKLEERFPPSEKHPALSSPDSAGLAALLQKFTVDSGVFGHAARMIPADLPLSRNKAFQKDRAQFMGGGRQDPRLLRKEGIASMRQSFDIMETLLSDGREWIAGTPQPSLADIEGIWPFDWVLSDLKAPEEYFSESIYPRLHAWKKRFQTVLKAAKGRAPKPISLKGEQAVQTVTAADFYDKDVAVETQDPMELKQGAFVELFPLDGGGFTHQDRGRLVKLDKAEIGIAVKATTGQDICIHAPRWQFRVREIEGGAAKL